MKKILKKVAAIACAAILTLGFSGCGLFEDNTGLTAYDIAVQNGFVGTEAEWLQSLKGANGEDAQQIQINDLYQEARSQGYSGTFLEFLKEYLQVDVVENNDTDQIAKNLFSVVSINCGFTKTVRVSGGWMGGTTTKEEVYGSAGSGVIVDLNKQAGNATIITNYHVIYDSECNTSNKISDRIYVYPYGAFNAFSTQTGTDESGDGIKVRYVGGAMDYDIAILQIEGSEYIRNSDVQAAEFGDSDTVQVGEKVYAIGNPGDAGLSVTSGVISVDSEYIMMYSSDGKQREVYYRVMRTDAAINSGNSGGALFDAYGKLIGITNAKSVEDGVDNLCYALPISSVKCLYDNLLENGGEGKKATLGIVMQQTGSSANLVDGEIVRKETNVVAQVNSGSIAQGKLNVGDIIESITIGGEKIEIYRRYRLMDLLLGVRKGDTITLGIVRDGIDIDVSFTFDKDEYFTTLS